jgi:hypothetical protein
MAGLIREVPDYACTAFLSMGRHKLAGDRILEELIVVGPHEPYMNVTVF